MFLSIAFAGILIAAPISKVPEPEWMANFRKSYELKEGEYVKRVAAPYIPERIDFILDNYSPPKNKEVDAENRDMFKTIAKWFTLLVEQSGTKLTRRRTLSFMGLASSPKDQRGDNLSTVSDAVERITGYESPEWIIDPKFKDDPLFEKGNLTVHGDFVIRKNAPVEKLAPQLEAIFRNECKVSVKLRVDTVEQDVFVVRGEFKLQPPTWRLNSSSKRLKTLIDIHATEAGLNPEYDHFDLQKGLKYVETVSTSEYSGTPLDFVRFVGWRVKTRMIWENELPSEPNFSWCSHTVRNPKPQDVADDCDPDKVLTVVSAQTGLTFKKEKRKVPVLVISPGDAK